MYLQADLNGFRTNILNLLENPAEVVAIVNKLNFAQCCYLLSVYRLETLRYLNIQSCWCTSACKWPDKEFLEISIYVCGCIHSNRCATVSDRLDIAMSYQCC